MRWLRRVFGGANALARSERAERDLDEELRRVTPVLEELRTFDLPISSDTYKWPVAERALALGAEIVNEFSGKRAPVRLCWVVEADAAERIFISSVPAC